MKYKLTDTTITTAKDEVMYRVEALKDFADVKAGDIGGWVAGAHNLSQLGDCWVADDAAIFGKACVIENARVKDKARIAGDAVIGEDAVVGGNAFVTDKVHIEENARVDGFATVKGYSYISGQAHVTGSATVKGDSYISGKSRVNGNGRGYDRIVGFNIFPAHTWVRNNDFFDDGTFIE